MIDIIIATYNRPQNITELVNDIRRRSIPSVNNIIVVDSTDIENEALKNLQGVIYVHSIHKNQPYQRYLGYRSSVSDFLLFLDDDMQIIDGSFCVAIENALAGTGVCGINLAFENLNLFLSQQQKHSFVNGKGVILSSFVRFAQFLSGRPTIKDGRMWFCGLRGKRIDGQYSEFFSGGAFAARREFLYKNFNFNLFSLYEEGRGKGEDAVLAYTLSKLGKIYNLPGKLFFHNDPGNSIYTSNDGSYQYRVAYSRQFLSNEYARLNGKMKLGAFLLTFWYNLWRLAGLFILCVKSRRFSGFKGYLKGAVDSIGLFFREDAHSYWIQEVDLNLN